MTHLQKTSSDRGAFSSNLTVSSNLILQANGSQGQNTSSRTSTEETLTTFSPIIPSKTLADYSAKTPSEQLAKLQFLSGDSEAFKKVYPGEKLKDQEKSFEKGTGMRFSEVFNNGCFLKGFTHSLKNIVSLEQELEEMDERIEELDLSGRKLTALPANIGRFKCLKTLKLTGNQIYALPASFFELWSLERLEVDAHTVAMHKKNFKEKGLSKLNSFLVKGSMQYVSCPSSSIMPDYCKRVGATIYSNY